MTTLMRSVAFIIFVTSLAAHAATWDDLVRACRDRIGSHGTGIHWTEECIQNIFTLRPAHPVITSIAPGTGPGFGAGLDWVHRYGRTELLPSAVYARSSNGSSIARGRLTIAVPPLSFARVDDTTTSVISVVVTDP